MEFIKFKSNHFYITLGLTFILLIFCSETFAGKIYWADKRDNAIRRSDLDGSNVQTIVSIDQPKGVALDIAGGKLYYSSSTEGKIYRSDLDGSNSEVLISTGLSNTSQMVLDIPNQKLFFLDGHQEVNKANLDGSGGVIINNQPGAHLRSLTLDPVNSKIYFSSSNNGTVQRSDFDGSNLETVINSGSGDAFTAIYGIAIDNTNNHIYWADAGGGTRDLLRTDLSGANQATIIPSGLVAPERLILDKTNNQIYIADWKDIERVNFDTTGHVTLVTGTPGTNEIWDMDVLLDNTLSGSSVEILAGSGAKVTLATVSADGLTQLLEGSDGSTFLSDQMVGAILASSITNITTTATVSGIHTVEIPYLESEIPIGFAETDLRLFHDTGSGIEDITFSIDTVNNIITGKTTSFSPFAVGVNPEPTTILMMFLSLFGLFFKKRN